MTIYEHEIEDMIYEELLYRFTYWAWFDVGEMLDCHGETLSRETYAPLYKAMEKWAGQSSEK